MQDGEVLLLENLRFDPREEKNDVGMASDLAALGDIYVNDAFGAAHRAHASTVGVAAFLPSYAGFLMQSEVEALKKILDQPERPFVAIIGGAKVSDKLAVLENLLPKVDTLLIGGGMANTFLLAGGHQVGHSLVEAELVDTSRRLMDQASQLGVNIELPDDVVVATSIDATAGDVTAIDVVDPEGAIFDIGPESARKYADIITTACTVFWNGPLGVTENPAFANGTAAVAKAVAVCTGYTVIGGGDSVSAIEQLGLADHIDHISTGGGASLEYLEGRELPGLAAIPEAE
jgi:phosphoglycerate kinase